MSENKDLKDSKPDYIVGRGKPPRSPKARLAGSNNFLQGRLRAIEMNIYQLRYHELFRESSDTAQYLITTAINAMKQLQELANMKTEKFKNDMDKGIPYDPDRIGSYFKPNRINKWTDKR